MTELRKAAERLLEALEDGWVQRDDWVAVELRQAIAEAEKEATLQEISDIGQWDTTDMAHRSGGLSVDRPVKSYTGGVPQYATKNELDIADRAYFAGKQAGIAESAAVKCEWVGLTDEEIDYIWGISPGDWEDKFAFPRAIEAKLKEKNT
jgi:hypothetical protein